jgi:hypothetical protein
VIGIAERLLDRTGTTGFAAINASSVPYWSSNVAAGLVADAADAGNVVGRVADSAKIRISGGTPIFLITSSRV